MKIYDTLSGEKKILKTITPGVIKLYVCGLTVYDYSHIGHARAMIVFDFVVRYLRHRQYQVIYVRNITDIDDKIIQRANENKESSDALTERFIHIMHEDEQALNLLPVDHEPRATQYIAQIIALIQQLEKEDIAYQAQNGDICFDVKKFKDYGKLSKRDVDKLLAGARIDIEAGKRDPLDFVLWKQAKPNEPSWDSPWGAGRPGWHIECSAMATALLDQPFDIHGGGMDLKFPHHENEIAQSEAAFHQTFAHYWMHVGLLNVNNEKMSKSLKNFFTIREVLAEYSAEVVRYFMLSAHYRSPVNFSKENLNQAKQSLTNLYLSIRDLNVGVDPDSSYTEKFHEALDDDFNSPVALSILFEMARDIHKFKETNKKEQANRIAAQLKLFGELFGILQTDVETFLKSDITDDFAQTVNALIEKRTLARQSKNWAESDRIRNELTAMGVVIEDTGNGTAWRKL